MKYSKGQIFEINHRRKGYFYCQAIKDFDTEKEEFYPLIDLYDREEFACRGSFCNLIPLSKEEAVKVLGGGGE